MIHAGSNFNHLIQSKKKQGHVLVTGGIYKHLRHPSYFGFFWWGLGTQVVLGNTVCLVGYAVVLWRFFRRRIESMLTLFRGLRRDLLLTGGDLVQKRKLCSSASSASIMYDTGTGRGWGYRSFRESDRP